MGGTLGSLNYHLSGSTLTGDGYRDHSAYSADNFWSKFKLTPNSRVKITAVLGWTNFFNQNPEGLNLTWFMDNPKIQRRRANPDAYTYNEYQRTKRLTSGFNTHITLTESVEANFSLYYRRTNYTESVPSSIIHRTFHTPGLTGQLNFKSNLGNVISHLSLGLNYAWQSLDEYKHPNLGNAVEGPELLADQEMTQQSVGLFLLERLELSPQWGVSGVIRFDRIINKLQDQLQLGGQDLSGEVAYQKVTGRLDLTWNPSHYFGLYASWGTGFLPPGTEELVNNPYAYGGYNTHLVPATSSGEEIGARGSLGTTLSYDLALFHIDTKNDFGRYRIPTRPLETFYGNIGSTRKYGLETSLAWYPSETFSLHLAYTYYHFKYKTVDTLSGETLHNTWVPNIPQHQLYTEVEYQVNPNFRVGAALEHVSSWYIDSTNRILENGYGKTDPYTLVLVRAAYKFEFHGTPLEIRLSGRNIFNVLYYGFTEPDPDGNSYQPAPPAEWSLGIRLGF